MTKVCHMTSAHGEEDIRIFHKECTSLANAGYDVYLVERGESREKNGVHIVGVGEILHSRLKRVTEGARRVYEAALGLDCDIYHLHDPELLPYGLKLKNAGKKVIFDSHENYTDQIRDRDYIPSFLTKPTAKLYSAYETKAFGRFDGLIHTCLRFGKDPNAGKCRNIAVIYNLPKNEEFYDRYDPSAEKAENSLCYVGSLSENRGIVQLVRAAHAAGCTLYLAGPFDSDEFRKKLEEMEEYQAVRYAGVLSRDQVCSFVQKCRIGMATLLNVGQYNQDDSLPTKAYEYMALGLPVILSRSPYNVRTMNQYAVGLCVDPTSVDEIAWGIRYILDHPDEAEQMGKNGRKAVREELNWKTEEKKLLSLYETIAAE